MEKNLREWLRANKISTYRFATMSDTSRQTISNILNDNIKPSLETALKLWRATGYEVRLASLFPSLNKILPDIREINDV